MSPSTRPGGNLHEEVTRAARARLAGLLAN